MVDMQYRCVGFERLAFSGFDLFINDYYDHDNLFASGCIIFYKKDDLFHFIKFSHLNVLMEFNILKYNVLDIEEGYCINLNNLYVYNFNKEEDRYITNDFVKVKPFYVLYEKLSDGNNPYCDCEKFCIGLERNQSLIFNSKKDAQTFIKDNQLKSKFIKVDKLFKINWEDINVIRRYFKTDNRKAFVNGRLE